LVTAAISEWSADDSDSRPTSSKPVAARPALDHLADAGDRTLAHRPGDHPRLAEPAAARAATEDLDRHPLVHGLGERHERRLGVGPRFEIRHRVLGHPPRYAGQPGPRGHPPDPSVREVVDLIARRDVGHPGPGDPQQELVPPTRASLGFPRRHQIGELQHRLLAVADDDHVGVVGDRLGVERGMTTPATTIGSASVRSRECSGIPARSSAVRKLV
jgi:hypothetical protein